MEGGDNIQLSQTAVEENPNDLSSCIQGLKKVAAANRNNKNKNVIQQNQSFDENLLQSNQTQQVQASNAPVLGENQMNTRSSSN